MKRFFPSVLPPPDRLRRGFERLLFSRTVGVVVALVCWAISMRAEAKPPIQEAAIDPDPFDVFLDQRAGLLPSSAPETTALTVGIEWSARMTDDGKTSFGALVIATLPLERFARPMRVSKVIAEPPKTAPPVPDPPPPPPERVLETIVISPAIARGAVAAACKTAGLDENEARLQALASKAKTSALLPELRLRATRVIDETESLAPTEYDPSRRTASGGTSTWLEARATFRLDRLVFADDEIAVEKLRITRSAERIKLTARVLEQLAEYQRAHSLAVDEQAKPKDRMSAFLNRAAAEATLDVLTGGWFSKAIAGVEAANNPSEKTANDKSRDAPNRNRADASGPPEANDAAHPSADQKPKKTEK
ncbi:MAG: hypothetical protein IPK82_13685 [Polyangiaceae bacterium]|nr:hypothetical protein [Polyangiaceae bacterium]